MSKEVHESLRKIAKGTCIVLLGTFIGAILTFLVRILIVRNLSRTDYGIFALLLTIISISVALGSLGLHHSVARFISYHRAQKSQEKVLGSIKAAIEIALIGGLVFFVILFFGATFLGQIFHNEALVLPLKIYACIVPFLLLLQVFCSVYRGFKRADIKVIFNDILLPVITFLSLLTLFFFGFTILHVIYAYIFATVLTLLLLAGYSYRNHFSFIRKYKAISMRKILLLFSLPLTLRLFMAKIVTWSDVLLLGYFKEEAIVGLYSAALPLAKYLPLLLTSVNFLYVPLATQQLAKNQLGSMKRTYAVLTKWVFAMALPFFLILFLFPGVILKFFFGAEYITANVILMILSFAFMLHIFLGPNGSTLVVLGKTYFLMWATLIAAIFNIILNIVLIPSYGMLGAAIASAVALTISNLLISIKLYRTTKMHPFTSQYIKPLVFSFISIAVVYYLTKKFLIMQVWYLPAIFIIFLFIYGFSLLLTKSFDKEDIMLLVAIEKKSKLNLGFLKKLLKRFI